MEIEVAQPGAMAACTAAAAATDTDTGACGRACMLRLVLTGALVGSALACLGLRRRRQDVRTSEWRKQQDATPEMEGMPRRERLESL